MMRTCAIPGCRIRGRHLTTCEDDGCRGCLPRLAENGLVCEVDVLRTYERLDEIRGLAPDVLLVAYGLVRRATGASGGKPGSRSPGNDDALDVLNDVNNRLTTIARDIAHTQRLQEPAAGPGVAETLTTAAKWLQRQMTWLARATDEQGGAYAASVFPEIADCARQMRSHVDGPVPKRYLGPCGAPQIAVDPDVAAEYGIHPANAALGLAPCDGDVYARDGAQRGRCTTCGAEVAADERRAWLDGEVRKRAFCRTDIEDAYGIKANTVTTWWLRGKVKAYWVTETGLHVQWVELKPDPALKGEALARREAEIKAEHKARGTKVFYLADVLDLAAGDAARREGDRATRARRTAARAAESETAA